MGPGKRSAANDGRRTAPAAAAEPLWDSDENLKAEDLDAYSSSSDESDDEEVQREQEIADAVLDYAKATRQQKRRSLKNPTSSLPPAAGGEEADSESAEEGEGGDEEDSEFDFGNSDSDDKEEEEESGSDDDDDDGADGTDIINDDPASDSSEDERPNRNTVGDIPLEWYGAEEHIGYDLEGKPVEKKGRRDALERLLARSDSAKEWRTIYDEYNGEEIVLSKEEMKMIQRIRAGKFAHIEVDPFEPENDWFSRDTEIMPLSGAPEPKRRFIPSKWEEKRVVKLVRAMRKGWLKRTAPEEAPSVYLMWQDDGTFFIVCCSGILLKYGWFVGTTFFASKGGASKKQKEKITFFSSI